MEEQLLTAGQFAKLARTTKRTVLWYDQQGILKPISVDESGYRYYDAQQILDFQIVLLMRKLGFSIADIRSLLSKDLSMRRLFETQRGALEQQIGLLTRMLQDINQYYRNLHEAGTLVQPKLKHVASFEMYYLAKQGPYARIKDYNFELCGMFDVLPKDAVWLTAFMTSDYEPAKARMKIGVVRRPGMRLKTGAKVELETVPAYEALTHVHVGSTTLLSLLWTELGKYRRKHHFERNTKLPFADIEFYRPDKSAYPDPDDSLDTEIQMPVLRPR